METGSPPAHRKARGFFLQCALLGVFMAWGVLMAGCSEDITEPGVPFVRVLELQVSVDDGIGTGEIEIHMFEDSTDVFIACVRMTGIEAGVAYEPNEVFREADDSGLLFDDVSDKTIWLQIFEDDTDACPAPFDPGSDDILVNTPPFDASIIAFGQEFRFSNVPSLVLGI
jgi:hypothetical protein